MEPRELYDKLFGAELYTNSYEQFVKDYGNDAGQKELHEKLSGAGYYDGDYNQFVSDYFVKKKSPSAPPSSVGSPTSPASSFTPPPAPTVGAGFDPLNPLGVQAQEIPETIKAPAQEPLPSPLTRNPADLPPASLKIDWETGLPKGHEPTERKESPTVIDYAKATPEMINRGFFGQFIGGTLKGAGELMGQGARLIDPNVKSEEMWLYQAGDEIQDFFYEDIRNADPAILESDYGQIMTGVGQVAGMILSAPKSIAQSGIGAGQSALQLLKASAQPAMIGSLQMVSAEADQVRVEKDLVDAMPKSEYIKLDINVGKEEEAARKYDYIKENEAEDIIAKMIPSAFAAGSVDMIPVAGWFGRLNKATGGSFTRMFVDKAKDVTVGTLEGAAQEAFQQWVSNATQQEVYDFTQETTADILQSAKVGGGTQFLLEVMGAALGVKNPKAKKLIDETQEKVAARAELQLIESTPETDFEVALSRRVANGELTQLQADVALSDFKAKKQAIATTPTEVSSDPEVVNLVAEKAKIDDQIEVLSEEKKSLDDAFERPIENEIEALEAKSDEKAIEIAEAAGIEPSVEIEKATGPAEPIPAKEAAEPTQPQQAAQEIAAAPPPVPVKVEPSELTPGETYQNSEGRQYIFEGKKDGMLVFEKVPKPGETLFQTKIEMFPDSMAAKDLFQKRAQEIESVAQPTATKLPTLIKGNDSNSLVSNGYEFVKSVTTKGADGMITLSQQQEMEAEGVDMGRAEFYQQEDGNVAVFLKPQVPQPTAGATIEPSLPTDTSISLPQSPAPEAATPISPPFTPSSEPPASLSAAGEPSTLTPPTETPPIPGKIGGTGEMRRSRFETEEGSMGKAEEAGTKTPLFKKIADENPTEYEAITLTGASEDAFADVEKKGVVESANELIERAKVKGGDRTFRPGDQARRQIVAIELMKMWTDAVANGDPNAREIKNLLAQTQADIAILGSEMGQENASLKIWQASPAGVIAEAILKIETVAQSASRQITEEGKTVEQTIDEFVAQATSEMSPAEIATVVESVMSKYAPTATGKQRVREGKRELSAALRALTKATSAKTSAGVGISGDQAKALVDVFKALAKIAKGSFEDIKTRFKAQVGEIVDADAAWKYLEDNHAKLLDAARSGASVDLIAKIEKERIKNEQLIQKEKLKAETKAQKAASSAIIKKAQNEIKRLKQVETELRKKALKDIDADALEAALRGRIEAGELLTQIPAKLAEEFGISDDAAQKIVDRLQQAMQEHITKTRAKEISSMVKQRMPKATPRARRTMEDKIIWAMALGGLNTEPLRRQIAEFYGVREFTPEEITRFQEIINNSENLPGDALRNERQLEILDYIKTEISGDSRTELGVGFWYAGALSAAPTHAVNAVGNAFLAAEDMLVRAIASVALRGAKFFGANVEGGGTKQAFANILDESWTIALEAERIFMTGSGSRDFSKFSVSPALERFSKKKGASPWLLPLIAYAKFIRYYPRALKMSDALFYGMSNSFMRGQQATRQAIAEGYTGKALDARTKEILGGGRKAAMAQARRELVDSGLPFTEQEVKIRAQEILIKSQSFDKGRRDYVAQVAEINTLVNKPFGATGAILDGANYVTRYLFGWTKKDDAGLEKLPAKLRTPAKNIGKITGAFFQVLFPFLRVPGNLTNKAIDYIPGVALGVRAWESTKDSWDVPTFKSVDEAANFAVRQAIGVGLMATLVNMIDWEDEDPYGIKVTAHISDDYNVVANAEAAGYIPWTISQTRRDGSRWSFMYRNTAASGAIAIIASQSDAVKFGKAEEISEERAKYMASAMIGYFSDLAMLKSFSGTLGFVETKDVSKLREIATRPVSGFLKPGWLNHLENIVSPERRNRKKGDDFVEKLGYSILANTAIADRVFFSKRRNAIGQVISPTAPAWYRGLGLDAIVKLSDAPDPIIKAMFDKGLSFPKLTRPTIFGVEADEKQYEKFTDIVGMYRYYRLSDEIDKINKASAPAIKKALTYDISVKANAIAKMLVFESDNLDEIDEAWIKAQMNDANLKQVLKRYKKTMKQLKLQEPDEEKVEFD